MPMEITEGALTVYDAANDTLIEEMWSADTEDNRTFTFGLSEPLRAGKSYCVNISGSFMAGLVDYYHGFDDKTTWNFTVEDGYGIPVEVEGAALTGNLCAA